MHDVGLVAARRRDHRAHARPGAVRERRADRDGADQEPRSRVPCPGTRTGVVDAAAALDALGSPEPRLRPVLFGDAIVGRSSRCSPESGRARSSRPSYRWERCRGGLTARAVEGATRSGYMLSSADEGFRLRAVVSAAARGNGRLAADAGGRERAARPRPAVDRGTTPRRRPARREPRTLAGLEPELRRQLAALPRRLRAGRVRPRLPPDRHAIGARACASRSSRTTRSAPSRR